MTRPDVKELNGSQCKCYLVTCPETHYAVLIDPHVGFIDRYLAYLAYQRIRIDFMIDTHTHADHLSGTRMLRQLLDIPVVQHLKAPNPSVDRHIQHGDDVKCGNFSMKVLDTPGHTPDSVSLYVGDVVFTGDVLLIGGTGRADFAGGDAGEQYDSITRQLFTLPDETVVLPAHDYRGNTSSTIGAEKQGNPRIAGKSRQEYIDLMNSIEFPLPKNIQEVLQPNQSAIDDNLVDFPDLGHLNAVRQRDARTVHEELNTAGAPHILDVREESEFVGELGHIPDSTLIPLRKLQYQIGDLNIDRDDPIVVVCRSGVRSTTAAAMLTGMGYNHVSNLKGGMLAWNEAGYRSVRSE
jgi:glyoxylase-like metal-dependent hydrolase (beta-lactamase superfamily II)/rhodanese-related sulfurtransferase